MSPALAKAPRAGPRSQSRAATATPTTPCSRRWPRRPAVACWTSCATGRAPPATCARRSTDLDRCTVMQHLKVLDEAGLVLVQRRGRERWNHLAAAADQAHLRPLDQPVRRPRPRTAGPTRSQRRRPTLRLTAATDGCQHVATMPAPLRRTRLLVAAAAVGVVACLSGAAFGRHRSTADRARRRRGRPALRRGAGQPRSRSKPTRPTPAGRSSASRRPSR